VDRRKRAGEILCPVTVEQGHGLRDETMAEARESRVLSCSSQLERSATTQLEEEDDEVDLTRDGTGRQRPAWTSTHGTVQRPCLTRCTCTVASHLIYGAWPARLQDDDFDLVESLSDFGAFFPALN
jgi:hypothetical protein